MSAYWVARATVRDPEPMTEYSAIVARLRDRYGFEPLSRGVRVEQLEGERQFQQHFLHRFPSMEAALAMYNSAEYQRAAEFRRAACGDCELVLLDGGDSVAG
ncbi:DUF1330 domain-containing protein [Amycolatopsis dendrobii]|uniref:DUF1330 domain-containing protein n=1 Tax=Amycolatopsis dendrobii TaxID=2760662 RepID=A0A7W3ZDJ3_9PSEU|nr:DUF1330 domain-containing protein [Amycolatopsis dendrobii]MBB1156944.1 DUF1330 domain-containing protein [Amycolatopsis dendrobii]